MPDSGCSGTLCVGTGPFDALCCYAGNAQIDRAYSKGIYLSMYAVKANVAQTGKVNDVSHTGNRPERRKVCATATGAHERGYCLFR